MTRLKLVDVINQGIRELPRSEIDTNWPKRPAGSKYLDHSYGVFSQQSQEIDSQDAPVNHINEFKASHEADSLVTPETATGIQLTPSEIEVLDLNDPGRIHNRQLFTRTDNGWANRQLMP